MKSLKTWATGLLSSTLLLLSPTLALAADLEHIGAETAVTTTPTFDIYSVIAIVVFVVGYIGITLEHKLHLHKSGIALMTGSLVWVIAAIASPDLHIIEETLHATGAEIFEIVAFLLTAMALVEVLVHYRFFDMIRIRLYKMDLNDQKQFVIISFLTFFLSAILDNLTITIVMTQIALRFFKGTNLLVMVSNIVIMANAGGAWSPIGDITTIMLWLADKFSAGQIIIQGFIPSFIIGGVSTALLYPKVLNDTRDSSAEANLRFSQTEKTIITLGLISFTFPLVAHSFGLRPYLGLIFGFGVVWTAIEIFKTRVKEASHLSSNIEELLQKVDIASLQFFIGILLAVSGLGLLGILDKISLAILGADENVTRIMIGNVVLGLLSAIVDNVPLTAMAIDIIHTSDVSLWVLLALAVGTGGSALIIGSVAGIIAMGMVKELRFDRYLKIATIPAVISYLCGMIAWYVQTMLVF